MCIIPSNWSCTERSRAEDSYLRYQHKAVLEVLFGTVVFPEEVLAQLFLSTCRTHVKACKAFAT